ncbi:MAG: transketolase, partial [Gammaproteobacteria bacterium]|nr:transketolase [Gammaproteobacteria bacterium]
QTICVDGHDVDEVDKAIISAKEESNRPTMIFCRTTIGFGSPNKSGTSDVHGAPLGDDEIEKTRKVLDWKYEPFEVPQHVYEYWDAKSSGAELNNSWDQLLIEYKKSDDNKHKELLRRISGKVTDNFDERYIEFLRSCNEENSAMATRKASQLCLDFFVKELPELVGGSADLTPSNNTFSKSSATFSNSNPTGNHINYGVREFGMSAIMNGMVLHGGIKPYGATFLVFTDYARNAVRLSALMKLPNIFVYTHDSIALGEDGPTHQPVEHLVTLRSTPNLESWRPADLVETAVAWKNAVNSKDSPTCLIFSRQNTSAIPRNQNQIDNIDKGGYLVKENDNASISLVASGSELQLILDAAEALEKDFGIASNVISMPCLDRFLDNEDDYHSSILKPNLPILVVELSHPNSWYKLLNKKDKVLGIETFGESAPANILLEHFGFTTSNVVEMAKSLVDE